jgi:ADP-ribose pyrophosphatase YjhB (NUDIX family)
MGRYKVFLSVDMIIEKDGKIVLIKRNHDPWKGSWALPGGFVDEGETIEEAAVREGKEETNLEAKPKEILGVYSDPSRDPRGHVVSTTFIMEVVSGDLKGRDDAKIAEWVSLEEIEIDKLAADHGKILNDFKTWKEKRGTFWSTK